MLAAALTLVGVATVDDPQPVVVHVERWAPRIQVHSGIAVRADDTILRELFAHELERVSILTPHAHGNRWICDGVVNAIVSNEPKTEPGRPERDRNHE